MRKTRALSFFGLFLVIFAGVIPGFLTPAFAQYSVTREVREELGIEAFA
jgi:hypothetical protein